MKYTGPTFRPPIEHNTLLLQVTVGCAHNKCTFCTMYKTTKFSIESIDQIERDLKEAKAMYGSVTRIFLINGDAFVLNATKLKEISSIIIEYFPEMETITMYASIRNIKDKTDNELTELRDARINDLWVGVETGNESAIEHMNKGYTLGDAYEQLARLKNAGIRHNAILMIGVAGSGKGVVNATDTAKLINITKPSLVGFTTLGVFPGSDLSREVDQNLFALATEREIIEEEKALIELIDLVDLPLYGEHPLNSTSLSGVLPRDKYSMVEMLDQALRTSDESFLCGSAERSRL